MNRYNYTITETHISQIRPFDTVMHYGEMKTVCRNNIKRGGFMGDRLFGDSYHSGRKPVLKIIFLGPSK